MEANGGSVIVDFQSLDSHEQKLILEAVEARKTAYCPYSKFAVGACLEVDNGPLYKGCNVENGVYPLCICAERTAVVKAVSNGHKQFTSIAVIGDLEHSFTTPCGSCRQFLAEFNPNMKVYVTRSSLGKVLVTSIDSLLPFTFHF